MLYQNTQSLILASLSFKSFVNAASILAANDVPDTPGTFSVPITYKLGAGSKFVASIAIGSQETEMDIIMDLGSPWSWLYGPNDISWGNQSISGPFNCHAEWTPYYNPNTSTTVTGITPALFELTYGGNSKVIAGSERVIDNIEGASGPLLPFLVATSDTDRQIDTLACANPPFDYGGIFGIAGSVNAQENYNASFRYNLQHPSPPQLPLIDSATMSVFLRNATTTPALQEIAGEVLLGGIDTSAFVGPLVTVANATGNAFTGYAVPFPTMSVAGVEVTFDPTQNYGDQGCALDSGTHEDIFPVPVVTNYQYDPSQFLAQTGLIEIILPDDDLFFAYPSACADIPSNATFDFTWDSPSGNNVTVKVPIRNYARNSTFVNDQSCILAIDVIGCTFGAPFLSGAYLFVDDDQKVVALAQAGEGTGGRVPIKSGEAIPGLIL